MASQDYPNSGYHTALLLFSKQLPLDTWDHVTRIWGVYRPSCFGINKTSNVYRHVVAHNRTFLLLQASLSESMGSLVGISGDMSELAAREEVANVHNVSDGSPHGALSPPPALVAFTRAKGMPWPRLPLLSHNTSKTSMQRARRGHPGHGQLPRPSTSRACMQAETCVRINFNPSSLGMATFSPCLCHSSPS
jgi:hypothetical protein